MLLITIKIKKHKTIRKDLCFLIKTKQANDLMKILHLYQHDFAQDFLLLMSCTKLLAHNLFVTIAGMMNQFIIL